MSQRRGRGGVIAAVAGSVVACGMLPTDMCACPPSLYHTRAFGTVTTADGHPVVGARMRARIGSPGCTAENFHPDPSGGSPPTAADGTYELHVYSPVGGPQVCVRIVAERAPGDSVYAEVPGMPMRLDRETAPRTRVDVVFP